MVINIVRFIMNRGNISAPLNGEKHCTDHEEHKETLIAIHILWEGTCVSCRTGMAFGCDEECAVHHVNSN